jgi:RNA polymerase sigma-70 factor (ECF subfamily)
MSGIMERTQSLQTLIAAVQADQSAAAECLYQKLVQPVFAFVSYRTATRDDAKDLTQDCIVEVFRALPRFTYQSDAAFHAFVFTIVRRQLARYYDRSKKTATEDLSPDVAASETTSPETTLALTEALKQLDECSREIVVLHHWSRYTFGEIATIVDMTEEAVRVRHHRAKAVLKDLLIK